MATSQKSNYAVGRNYETEFKKELEAKGYIVFRPPWVRFSKQMDVFNIFDLLAYHPEKNDLIMVQLTTSQDKSKYNTRLKKVQGFELKEIKLGCIQKGGEKFYKKYRVVASGS